MADAAEDRAFFNAYDGVEVPLANGGTAHCRALTLAQAAHFLRLLGRIEGGDGAAVVEVMETFPKAVGAPDAFDRLMPAEFFDAVRVFFTLRRPARTPPERTPPPVPPATTT